MTDNTGTAAAGESNTSDAGGAETTRRALLAAVGVAAAGASGYYVGGASAQSAPEGYVGTTSNPYRRAYVDRIVFVERSSDPSSPDDGTIWYNP